MFGLKVVKVQQLGCANPEKKHSKIDAFLQYQHILTICIVTAGMVTQQRASTCDGDWEHITKHNNHKCFGACLNVGKSADVKNIKKEIPIPNPNVDLGDQYLFAV